MHIFAVRSRISSKNCVIKNSILQRKPRKTMRKLKKQSTSYHWKWQAPKHKVSIVPARYSIFVPSCMRQRLKENKAELYEALKNEGYIDGFFKCGKQCNRLYTHSILSAWNGYRAVLHHEIRIFKICRERIMTQSVSVIF